MPRRERVARCVDRAAAPQVPTMSDAAADDTYDRTVKLANVSAALPFHQSPAPSHCLWPLARGPCAPLA